MVALPALRHRADRDDKVEEQWRPAAPLSPHRLARALPAREGGPGVGDDGPPTSGPACQRRGGALGDLLRFDAPIARYSTPARGRAAAQRAAAKAPSSLATRCHAQSIVTRDPLPRPDRGALRRRNDVSKMGCRNRFAANLAIDASAPSVARGAEKGGRATRGTENFPACLTARSRPRDTVGHDMFCAAANAPKNSTRARSLSWAPPSHRAPRGFLNPLGGARLAILIDQSPLSASKFTILALATSPRRRHAVLGTANVHNFAFLEATRVLPSLSADNRTMCLDDDNATIAEMACPADRDCCAAQYSPTGQGCTSAGGGCCLLGAALTPGSNASGLDPALPNCLVMGDSVSIGYEKTVAEQMAGACNVQHAPWDHQNGGWASLGGSARVPDIMLLSATATPVAWDVIFFVRRAARARAAPRAASRARARAHARAAFRGAARRTTACTTSTTTRARRSRSTPTTWRTSRTRCSRRARPCCTG